jgi:hypothetical protein
MTIVDTHVPRGDGVRDLKSWPRVYNLDAHWRGSKTRRPSRCAPVDPRDLRGSWARCAPAARDAWCGSSLARSGTIRESLRLSAPFLLRQPLRHRHRASGAARCVRPCRPSPFSAGKR